MTPAVLQSAYPLEPRTSQGSPPPVPVTPAALQSAYPGAMASTVAACTELPDEAPPVLNGSAAREADAYFRIFDYDALAQASFVRCSLKVVDHAGD